MRRARQRPRGRSRSALGGALGRLALGWLLIGCAWAWANPPLAAPDEADHFVRAVGIAQGTWVGAPAPQVSIGADPAEIAFDHQTQRAVTLPAGLDPLPYSCYLADPRLPAGCLNRPVPRGSPVRRITSVGTYPPTGLLAPAALISAAHDLPTAVRLGRLAALALSLIALIAAAAALYEPAVGGPSLAGIVLACTPTVLFLAASLNPSGMSIAAAVAFVAALLRLSRDGPAPGGVWLLAGVGGGLLACSHPTGIGWTVVLLAGFAVWQGPGRLRRLAVAGGYRAAGIGLFAVGLAAALAWQLAYGPSTPIAYRAVRTAVERAPSQYWSVLRQAVGGFGYLEFHMPLELDLAWLAVIVALGLLAARGAAGRERRALLGAALGVVAVPILAWLIAGRAAGVGMIAREYMPLLVALPLLAGELVVRRRPGRAGRRLVTAGIVVAGAVQFADWYLNGRRAAVGISGPLDFIGQAAWAPPLGWIVWCVVAALGALALASVSLGSPPAGVAPPRPTTDRVAQPEPVE